MLDDNYGQELYQQMSNNVSSQYYITTDTTAVPPNYGGQLTITPAVQHNHAINPLGGLWYDASRPGINYEESFGKLIIFILGSSKVSQDIKDEFINQGMRLEEFRKYVKEYFPQYIDKITLWEKLHLNEK